METRILETTGRSPRQVETCLSDREALEAIASRTDTFAKDLVASAAASQLTHNRLVWVHILAMEQFGVTQPKTQLDAKGLTRVVELFNVAKLHLKKPKIRLQTPDGLEIAISPAPAKGRNAGFLYVVGKDDQYYGKIAPDGEFQERGASQALKDLLIEFAANPAETAMKYGRLTGKCCFCALPLKDERSTQVGYGETCARNWDLAWGKVKTDLPKALGGAKPKRPVKSKSAPVVPQVNRTEVDARFAQFDATLETLFAQL